MNLVTTGKTIAKLRKDAGLTQASLAEKLGISDKAVSKWERGVSCPDVSLWGRLSVLLDTDIETLIYGHSIGEDWIGILVLDNNVPADSLIYDKPLINYLISQFLLAGIKEITVVGNCKISIPEIKIHIVDELNQQFTRNAFVIFGNQFIYGPNLTRHIQRAMYSDELSILAVLKGKGKYPLSIDSNKYCCLSNQKSENTYYALPYAFVPAQYNIDSFKSLLCNEPKVEQLERGMICFTLDSYDSIIQMGQFVKMMEHNSGEQIANLVEIIERRK